MLQELSRPRTYLAMLLLLLMGGWLSYLPFRVAQNFKSAAQEQIGRLVTVGASSYRFSPQFSIAIQNVTVAGTEAMTNPIVDAKAVYFPLSISSLFSGIAAMQPVLIEGADIHVAFDGVGHNNVFSGQSPKSNIPFSLNFRNSKFSYFDERSGDQFGFEQFSGNLKHTSDGEVIAAGTAVVKGQFVKFEAALTSLERVFSDGSPLDLSVEGVATTFAFSGRLATEKRLNLAGLAEMQSTDAPRLMQWLGVDLASITDIKSLKLSGALDSDGPVMFLTDASLKYGNSLAKGAVSFSNSGERPNITAALDFDLLNLNSLRTKTAENWDDKPLDFSSLNALDMQFRFSTDTLLYNELKIGSVNLEGALKNRVLKVEVKSQDFAGGSGQLDVDLNATQLPPLLKLDVSLKNVAAEPAFAIFSNHRFLSGPLTLESQLQATGSSQAEIISTMSGQANVTLLDGTLAGANLASLASLPMKGWNGGQTKNLNGQAQFTFNEGLAKLGENQFSGSGFSFQGEGEIDILRRSLDLLTGPQIKVKIQGPWSMPTLTPQ